MYVHKYPVLGISESQKFPLKVHSLHNTLTPEKITPRLIKNQYCLGKIQKL